MYFGNYRWHLSIVMLSQYDGMRAIACTNSSLLDVGREGVCGCCATIWML